MMAEIPMHVDAGDEWPDIDPNTPGRQFEPGKFDISTDGVDGYPQAQGRIEFACPNKRHCSVLIGPQFVARPAENMCNIWGWDGNREKPTLSPSINCIAEKDGKPTSGCGWHGFIQQGRLVW